MVTSASAVLGQVAASIPAVSVGSWLLAISPVVLLLALVLWGRWSTITNAAVTVVYSVAVGVLAFGADGLTVGVGLGKGAWVGLWILYVIWPALLMHHFASTVGMTALGRVLSTILPRRSENVLLLAWILPSFIQGVSGFGTPIAVAAPLLFALGVGAARSVALPLIGYHWAVGLRLDGLLVLHGRPHRPPGRGGHRAVRRGGVPRAGGQLRPGRGAGRADGRGLARAEGGLAAGRRGRAGDGRGAGARGPARARIGALCAGGAGVAVVLLLHLLHRGGATGRRTASSAEPAARQEVTVPADARRVAGGGAADGSLGAVATGSARRGTGPGRRPGG